MQWKPCHRTILLVVAAVVIVSALAILGRALFVFRSECVDIDKPPVRSSNGKWTALSTIKSCPAGFVTNYAAVVTLAQTPAPASANSQPVPIFENIGSSEPNGLAWASANDLILTVDDAGQVRKASTSSPT
jgi:hypothetical protein